MPTEPEGETVTTATQKTTTLQQVWEGLDEDARVRMFKEATGESDTANKFAKAMSSLPFAKLTGTARGILRQTYPQALDL